MGIEYIEYRMKLKNNKTGEVIEIIKQLPHDRNTPLYWEKDFDVVDFKVVYG